MVQFRTITSLTFKYCSYSEQYQPCLRNMFQIKLKIFYEKCEKMFLSAATHNCGILK